VHLSGVSRERGGTFTFASLCCAVHIVDAVPRDMCVCACVCELVGLHATCVHGTAKEAYLFTRTHSLSHRRVHTHTHTHTQTNKQTNRRKRSK